MRANNSMRQKSNSPFRQNYQNHLQYNPNFDEKYKNSGSYIVRTPEKFNKRQQPITPPTALKTPEKISLNNYDSKSIIMQQPSDQLDKPRYQKPIAYSYDTLQYREAVYFGKLIHLDANSTLPQPETETLPHLRQLNSHEAYHYKTCKHGPGILILDSGIWIIGKWIKDSLTGQTAYCIGADLGILQIKLHKDKNTNQDEKNQPGQLQVSEINFTGYELRNALKQNKYYISGRHQRSSSSSQNKDQWDWMVSLPQGYQQLKTQNNDKIDLTSSKDSKNDQKNQELLLELKDYKFIEKNSIQKQKWQIKNKLPTKIQTKSYQYFVSKIKDILIQSKDASSQTNINFIDEHFKIQQVTEMRTIQSTNKPAYLKDASHQSKQQTTTVISSNFNLAQQVYIKIKCYSRANPNGSKEKAEFKVEELGISVKDMMKSRSISGGVEKYEHKYWNKYLYKVSQIQNKLYTINQNQIALPNYYVKEQLSNKPQDRYCYKIAHNIHVKQKCSYSPYISEYTQYQKLKTKKSNYHVGSLKYQNVYHTKLIQSIHKLFVAINTVYYYSKYIQKYGNSPTIQDGTINISLNKSSGQKNQLLDRIKSNMQKSKQEYIPRNRQQQNFSIMYDHNKLECKQASLADIKKQLQQINFKHHKAKPKQNKQKFTNKNAAQNMHTKNKQQPIHTQEGLHNNSNLFYYKSSTKQKILPKNNSVTNSKYRQQLKWTPPHMQLYEVECQGAQGSNIKDPQFNKLIKQYESLDQQLIEQASIYNLPASLAFSMITEDAQQQRKQYNKGWKNQRDSNISQYRRLKDSIVQKHDKK